MKKQAYGSDVEECKHKIKALLGEYNAHVEYDLEIGRVLLVDKDTNKFEPIDKD